MAEDEDFDNSTKRKREETPRDVLVNGTSNEHTLNNVPVTQAQFKSSLTDILEVLRRYDTNPSVLNFQLPADAARASAEPSPKRPRLSPSSAPVTIASRLKSSAYSSISELSADVASAAAEILKPIQSKETVQNGVRPPPLSIEERQTISGVLGFEKMLKNITTRELSQHAQGNGSKESLPNGDAMVNGDVVVKQEDDEQDNFQSSRAVLTLYGNAGAQGPKQLFSSLQKPTQIGASSYPGTAARLDTSVDVITPLRESNLPNMISTTKIIPMHADDSLDGKKRGPTFGDVFAPPVTVPQLSPPKHPKQLTTRSTSVSWVHGDPAPRNAKRGSYNFTNEKLATGQWLGYGGVDPPQAPTSPEAKRKQRDRALSTGEANPRLSEGALAALEQAKEDALFRSVYSSFAPSCDDTTAVVPEQTKNQLWWNKVGARRSIEAASIDPALLSGEAEANPVADAHTNGYKEDEFRDAVDAFEPDTLDPPDKSHDEAADDIEGLLKEIGELLETLYSHQRIRNASLAPSSRTPVSQNTPLTTMTGTPSDPSNAELDVYTMLKSQLTLLISTLPPYAVAKLNGDQLAELNISRNIVVEGKDYRGVMEEDQVSRLQKAAALNAAVGPPPISRAASSLQPHYQPSPHQSRPSGAHLMPNRPPQGAQSYYPQQQPPNRPPGLHAQRSSSGLGQPYNAGSYPNSQRPPYNPQQYPQQPARPGYGQPGSQYYQQRPPQQGYGQYYGNTPGAQTQPRNYQQPPPPSAYQQRPTSGQGYAAQSPNMRTASPLKPAPPAPTQYTQSRPAYGTPSGQGRQHFQQPSSQYGSQPSTPAAASTVGYQTPISSAEQQSIMERQRAQLNIQPRTLAQGPVDRQNSGTPQGMNGQPPPQVNGTPMAT